MNTETIHNYILELIKETSIELLKINLDNPSDRKTRLKFPKYRNGKKRISEQELRFVMTHLLSSDFYYSIETPTLEKYSFSEGGERSAATDLSVYHNDLKILNIELKAHNPGQKSIDKDIEKLVREDCDGAWVHLLVSERSNSVEALFKKFIKAFENKHSKRPISFHILILDTMTLLSRKGKINESDYSNNIFNINYSHWKNLNLGTYQYLNGEPILDQSIENDWQINKFSIK